MFKNRQQLKGQTVSEHLCSRNSHLTWKFTSCFSYFVLSDASEELLLLLPRIFFSSFFEDSEQISTSVLTAGFICVFSSLFNRVPDTLHVNNLIWSVLKRYKFASGFFLFLCVWNELFYCFYPPGYTGISFSLLMLILSMQCTNSCQGKQPLCVKKKHKLIKTVCTPGGLLGCCL